MCTLVRNANGLCHCQQMSPSTMTKHTVTVTKQLYRAMFGTFGHLERRSAGKRLAYGSGVAPSAARARTPRDSGRPKFLARSQNRLPKVLNIRGS